MSGQQADLEWSLVDVADMISGGKAHWAWNVEKLRQHMHSLTVEFSSSKHSRCILAPQYLSICDG